MSNKQCFACLSYLPSEVVTSKRAAAVVASTLNNFQIEIKDLMGSNVSCDLLEDKTREQFVENLSVCSNCLNPIKLVISSKSKVDKVESTVRILQLDLLKQLKKLEQCLEGLMAEMEVVGGIIQNTGGGERQTATDNGLSDDVWIFRKDFLDVKERLQMFKNGMRHKTNNNSPNNQSQPSDSIDIRPPTSIEIKAEPETISFNLDDFHEDSNDLSNSMEYDDHFDSLSASGTPASSSQDNNPDNPHRPAESQQPVSSTPPKKWSRSSNKCTKCPKTFSLKSDLLKHQKIDHPNDRLQETVSCSHCGETMSRQLLRTHKLHHCPIFKKNKPITFPCMICKENFPNADLLKEHNLEIHVEKLKYMCNTCGKISLSRQANETHQKTHEDPRNRQTVECEDCGKLILSTSIGSHRRLGCPKRENSSFLCKFCQKYFSNESNLGKHIRRMHKGHKMVKGGDKEDDEPPVSEMGLHRRKIKVIAEDDDHDFFEKVKSDEMEEKEDDSGSEFIPSEGETEEKIERISQKVRRKGAPIKCPKCPRIFTWTLAFKKHKIAYHKNDWLLEPEHCPRCLEKMPRKLLRTHQFYYCPVKSKDIIYSCTLCKPSLKGTTNSDEYKPPKFLDLQSLKSHVKANHPKKMLELICDKCGLISKSMFSHRQHQLRHVPLKNREFVECDACGKSILSTSINSHQRLGCPKREKTRFPCVHCTKTFSTENAVVNHVNRWHTGLNGEFLLKPRRPKQLQCHLCGKWIQDKAAMRRHVKSSHQSWEERDDKIVCEFCGKKMLSANLPKHEKYHCPGKEREVKENVTCEVCGKMYKSVAILQWHKKLVHGNKKFVCEICGKAFSVKCNYTNHLQRHKGIRRFICESGCGGRFTQKAHLNKHIRHCRGEKGPRKQRGLDSVFVGNVERKE